MHKLNIGDEIDYYVLGTYYESHKVTEITDDRYIFNGGPTYIYLRNLDDMIVSGEVKIKSNKWKKLVERMANAK